MCFYFNGLEKTDKTCDNRKKVIKINLKFLITKNSQNIFNTLIRYRKSFVTSTAGSDSSIWWSTPLSNLHLTVTNRHRSRIPVVLRKFDDSTICYQDSLLIWSFPVIVYATKDCCWSHFNLSPVARKSPTVLIQFHETRYCSQRCHDVCNLKSVREKNDRQNAKKPIVFLSRFFVGNFHDATTFTRKFCWRKISIFSLSVNVNLHIDHNKEFDVWMKQNRIIKILAKAFAAGLFQTAVCSLCDPRWDCFFTRNDKKLRN